MNPNNRRYRPRPIRLARSQRSGRLHYGFVGVMVITAVLFGFAVVTLSIFDLLDETPLEILDSDMKIATIILTVSQFSFLATVYAILWASASAKLEWMKCGLRVLSILLTVTVGCAILFTVNTIKGIQGKHIKQILVGIENYPTGTDMDASIDMMQKSFKCCGFQNYSDWSINEKYKCPISNESTICLFPASCCEMDPASKTQENQQIPMAPFPSYYDKYLPRSQHGCYIDLKSLNFSIGSVVETKTENSTVTFYQKTIKRKFFHEGCYERAEKAVMKFGIGALINSLITVVIMIMIIAATVLLTIWCFNDRLNDDREPSVNFRTSNDEVELHV